MSLYLLMIYAKARRDDLSPDNANGGGLSYVHSGMYGIYALQESVRIAPARIPGAKISVCHGVGGMFAASGTIIMSNKHRLSAWV